MEILEKGNHVIIWGDALEALSNKIPDGSVDLIFIDPPYNTSKVPGNVWEFPRVRYRMEEYENHPTQKPVALLERMIRASSNPGDVVLDLFSGTFTTSFVAKKLGRKSIGIEIEEAYIKIGLRRL